MVMSWVLISDEGMVVWDESGSIELQLSGLVDVSLFKRNPWEFCLLTPASNA